MKDEEKKRRNEKKKEKDERRQTSKKSQEFWRRRRSKVRDGLALGVCDRDISLGFEEHLHNLDVVVLTSNHQSSPSINLVLGVEGDTFSKKSLNDLDMTTVRRVHQAVPAVAITSVGVETKNDEALEDGQVTSMASVDEHGASVRV